MGEISLPLPPPPLVFFSHETILLEQFLGSYIWGHCAIFSSALQAGGSCKLAIWGFLSLPPGENQETT